MRPVRLSMTAFGPYPATEVVDFEALAELGLFAVAGRNGAGKTTIFDGLHFALYGTLPGRRSTYQRLRSDHAAPDAVCRVELDFLAAGERWRVAREPRQHRAKRRGTGHTETQQQAVLSRFVDDAVVVEHNRINEVNERCRELVGLNGAQFERVALLPQGEFSRVLRESSTQRRDLLRALFASDVFAGATQRLADDATAAARNLDVDAARFDERLHTIVAQVCALCDDDVDSDTVAIAEAIDAHETSLLPLAATVDELRNQATQRGLAVQRAIDLTTRIEQRNKVRRLLGDHNASAPQVDRDLERLRAARAAVPVVNAGQVVHNQRAAEQAAAARSAELQHQLAPHLNPLRLQRNGTAHSSKAAELKGPPTRSLRVSPPSDTDELDEVASVVAAQTATCTAAVAALERIDRLHAELARLDAERTQLEERRRCAQARRDELATRQAELIDAQQALAARPGLDDAVAAHDVAKRCLDHRIELRSIDRQIDELRHHRRANDERRQALDVQLDAAATARRDQAAANQRAAEAADALAVLESTRAARQQLDVLAGGLGELRTKLNQAQRASDRAFDSYVRGASARLAETLSDGEPCTVCGSDTHPRPAAAAETVVTEADLAAARAAVDDLRSRAARHEQQIELLLNDHGDLDQTDVAGLDEAIKAATARAIATDNEANDTTTRAAQFDTVRRELAALDDDDRAHQLTLGEVTERQNRLIGSLGDAARCSVDELNVELAAAAQTVESARRAGDEARRLVERLDDTHTRLNAVDRELHELATQHTACVTKHRARSADLSEARASAPDDDQDPRQELVRLNHIDGLLVELRAALAEQRFAANSRQSAELTLHERLVPSPFADLDAARRAALPPPTVEALEAATTSWITRRDQLVGEVAAFDQVPDIGPDVDVLRQHAVDAENEWRELHRQLQRQRDACARLRAEITDFADQYHRSEAERQAADRLIRVAGLVKGDNDLNMSLENWVLAAHLRDVVELANLRLSRSTAQRFRLCVLDDGENRRGRWGLDLAVEDTVTGTRRPTAGLSGGELFQASLALALGLADAVMNQRAGVRIDALFIDEGFGSLDETAIERVIDLLDDVRSRGATVGVITHVTALLDVLPRGISVVPRPDGNGSRIDQPLRAA